MKTRKVYPYRSITKADHLEVFPARIFSISNLILYEPRLGPAMIAGIDNSILVELFLEFQNLLLKTVNREMVHSTTSGIKLRATKNNQSLEEGAVISNLALALSDLHLSVRVLSGVIKKRA